MPPTRQLHACLMFHSVQSDNLGVLALTVSQIELLRGLAKRLNIALKITVLDWNDPGAPSITGPDISHVPMTRRDMLDPRGALARMRAADVIFDIGAGDSFTDLYGPRRFRRMLWLKNLARMSGTPIVLAPQTYGPFKQRTSKFWAARTIRTARLVATRDKGSLRELERIDAAKDVVVASDLALRLPGHGKPRLKGVNIGPNVSGLLWNGGYSGDNQFSLTLDYRKLMRDVIVALRADPSAPQIWLVPHVLSKTQPIEDDLRASRELSDMLGGVRLAPAFETPQAAKGFISGLDYFSGARMHSCIAAFSSGVPVVPLAYSGKFQRLFGALGYKRTADCRMVQQDSVHRQIVDGFLDRDVLREEMRPALAKGLTRLDRYDDAIAKVIDEVAREAVALNPADRVRLG